MKKCLRPFGLPIRVANPSATMSFDIRLAWVYYTLMSIMKRYGILISLCLGTLFAISCAGAPEPVEPEPATRPEPVVEPASQPEPAPLEPAPATPAVVPFDPASVSVELKEATFFDVKALIQNLNAIIQSKDYASWVSVLTPEYREYYSSSETLARLSDSLVLRRQGIVLRSLQDYFIHVVYPSRQNDRVDDIEFIDPDRIKAIIITPKGERLVLYNLEKIDDTWKIAIWR